MKYKISALAALSLFSSSSNAGAASRQLYQTFTSANNKSNFCKTRCIDIGSNYCPMADYQNGYCCAPGETCPRADSCTDDDASAPNWFKYILCPNENECGNNQEKIVQPSADGTKTVITVVNDRAVFDVGDMCGYIVKAPDDMGKWDSLRMVVS